MSRNILIIDDDPEFTASTRDLLEASGYTVAAVEDGEEGLAAARSAPPDLMILDVMMAHDSEGFDVSRRMREDEVLRDIPILMITGIRREMNLPYRFEPDGDWLPVNHLLEKPVPPARLLAEVKNLMKD